MGASSRRTKWTSLVATRGRSSSLARRTSFLVSLAASGDVVLLDLDVEVAEDLLVPASRLHRLVPAVGGQQAAAPRRCGSRRGR